MRVLNYVTSTTGGAGRAALNLNKALRDSGIDSWIIALHNPEEHPFVLRVERSDLADTASGNVMAERQEKVRRSRTSVSNTLFSTDFVDFDFLSSEDVRSFDVHHLHWTIGFVQPSTVALMLRGGMNVIWTLHDMWALTGGCHYSAGCLRYESLCTECPQLFGEQRRVVPALQATRTAFLNSPHLVVNAPSLWLSHAARSSRALANCRHISVPNSANMTDFAPASQAEKRSLRERHGIVESRLVLACIAQDFREQRKGFALLALALQRVRTRIAAPQRAVSIVAVGYEAKDLASCGCDLVDLGHLSKNECIRDAIVVADFVLQIASDENYSNVIMESFACGVPVIASTAGGNKEIVCHGSNGFLVDLAQTSDELEALLTDLITRAKIDDFSQACLDRAKIDMPTNVATRFQAEMAQAFPRLQTAAEAALGAPSAPPIACASKADGIVHLSPSRIRNPTPNELSRLDPREKVELLGYLAGMSGLGIKCDGEVATDGYPGVSGSATDIEDSPLLSENDPFSFFMTSPRGPAAVGLKTERSGATVIGSRAVLSFRTAGPGRRLVLGFDVALYADAGERLAFHVIADGLATSVRAAGPRTIDVALSERKRDHRIEIVVPSGLRSSDGETDRLGRLFLLYGELIFCDVERTPVSHETLALASW